MKTFIEFYLENTKDYKFPITTTTSKTNVIANENKFINTFVKRAADDQVVGVVGRVEGLDRHIRQFVDLGFSSNNILLFELDNKMAEELKTAAIGKLPQYTENEYGELQVATDEHGNEKVRVVMSDILQPGRSYLKHDQPWFNPAKVTHADLDFTSTADPVEIKNEITTAFNVYPNIKSLVCVHSLRGSNVRSDAANTALSGPLKKLDDFFAKGVMVSKTGKPIDRVSEFRNVYDYYINREKDTSGKQQFLKGIQQLCGGSVYVQTYQGASVLNPGQEGGAQMVSITILKKDENVPEVIKADDSIYKSGNITDTDKKFFPGMYKSFKSFYENSKTPEGFNTNKRRLEMRGVAQYTDSDYKEYMELLNNMYNWFIQETAST